MKEIITSLLLLGGAAWIVIAAIGVVRLPDVLCRSHAVAKALTLGIFLMLLGLWVHLGSGAVGFKIVLAMLFQLTTIPLASHMIALLARQKNLRLWQPPRPGTGASDQRCR